MLNFFNEEHERFYKRVCDEMSKLKKLDCYDKALIYILSVCETTREHFAEIFDIEEGININSLKSSWQTGTSLKVTRMAFNLYNDCMYDSEEDIDKGQISEYYNPSDIFACSYANYFFEAIKIRYPEYTRVLHITENVKDTKYLGFNEDKYFEEEER